MDRYYCDTISPFGELILPEHEIHHALHVKRLRDGEEIEIFDGRGHSAVARATVNKKQIRCRLAGDIRTTPAPPNILQLAAALPKADRSDQLLDSVSQLGMHTVWWIDFRRSVVKVDGTSKVEKWRRIAIESAKQSRRNWLMNIRGPFSLDEFLSTCSGAMLFADPSAPQHLADWAAARPPLPLVTIFIGPEGGLTADEIQKLRDHGAEPIGLGPHILRIETAATAAAAAMGSWLMRPLS